MIQFELKELIPSNNVIMRMHHRQRTKEHERWTWMVREKVGVEHDGPYEICVLQITRFAPRYLDWDNMGGGCKFLLDAMVKNKLIVDDDPSCVTELILGQHKTSGKGARTLVLITPL